MKYRLVPRAYTSAIILALLILTSCHNYTRSHRETINSCSSMPQALETAAKLLNEPSIPATTCASLNTKDFREKAESVLIAEQSETHLELEEEIFKEIGLIPKSFQYASCLRKAYTKELAAFYSATLKQIVLPNWYRVPFRTLVHEAIHVDQDVKLQIDKRQNIRGFFHDEGIAFGAFLEGESIFIEEAYLKTADDKIVYEEGAPHTSNGLDPENCNLPKNLLELFNFQYLKGLHFWMSIVKAMPDYSRKQFLLSPPLTTQEILLPSLYTMNLKQKRAPLPHCHIRGKEYQKRFGVKMLHSLFHQHFKEEEIKFIITDWRDDCLTHDDNKWRWKLSFSSNASASKFYNLIKHLQKSDSDIFTGTLRQIGSSIEYLSYS